MPPRRDHYSLSESPVKAKINLSFVISCDVSVRFKQTPQYSYNGGPKLKCNLRCFKRLQNGTQWTNDPPSLNTLINPALSQQYRLDGHLVITGYTKGDSQQFIDAVIDALFVQRYEIRYSFSGLVSIGDWITNP